MSDSTIESPIKVLAQILKTVTTEKFQWNKKTKTYEHFIRTYLSLAESSFGLKPEALEEISLTAARDYQDYKPSDYNKLITNPNTRIEYNGMPYVVYIDYNGETCIIFRTKTNAIQDITIEMMEIVKYMGIVRVYVSSNFRKAIPGFPDNVIEILCESGDSLYQSDIIDFRMPAYLRGFLDSTNGGFMPVGQHLKCVNRFPNTLLHLETSEPITPNLPEGLINLSYIQSRHYIDDMLLVEIISPILEYLPRSVRRVKVIGSNFRSSICIQPVIDYFEFSIGQIMESNSIFIDGATKIRIMYFSKDFTHCVKAGAEQITNFTNLEFVSQSICDDCDDGTIRQDFEQIISVSFGPAVEHLLLSDSFRPSVGLLKFIDRRLPNNLKSVTISNLQDINTLDDIKIKIAEYSRTTDALNMYVLKIYLMILEFHISFPSVSILFMKESDTY
jgi:hypothetical protein